MVQSGNKSRAQLPDRGTMSESQCVSSVGRCSCIIRRPSTPTSSVQRKHLSLTVLLLWILNVSQCAVKVSCGWLSPAPPHQALGACEGGGREAEVICIHLRKNLFASCLTLLLLPLLLLLLLILTLFPGNVFPVTRCVGVVLHHCRSKLWDQ